MSTKLKRTPLFGQDGHLGIPIIANNNKHKIQVIMLFKIIIKVNANNEKIPRPVY